MKKRTKVLEYHEPKQLEQVKHTSINVWIIDDNHLFRKVLGETIQNSKDMRCSHSFSTCEEAIKALKAGEGPDVCLLDINFKHFMNGIKGVAIIKKIYPETNVIMLSVYDDEDNIFESLCAGAIGYLVKGSDDVKILDSIRDVVKGGSPMNAQIANRLVKTFQKNRNKCIEYHLSEQENIILKLMSHGLTNKEIAEKIFLSPHTIDSYNRRIYEKLHVHSRTEAITKMLKVANDFN